MADFNVKDICGEHHSSEFGIFNTLGVTVASNGYQGGDSGRGGRTYICIENLCSTDIDAVVSYGQDTNAKVEIMLGGDSELDSMIYALRWAADKLEDLKNSHYNSVY